MCREHQLLKHLATTRGNTRVCFSSTKAFSLHLPSHRPLLCSPRRLRFGLMNEKFPLNSEGGEGAEAVRLGGCCPACSEERSAKRPTPGPVTSGDLREDA